MRRNAFAQHPCNHDGALVIHPVGRRGNADGRDNVRLFIAGPKFVYDFRPPQNPTRISPPKKSGIQFNAVSPYPTGGALFVGPNGSIAIIP